MVPDAWNDATRIKIAQSIETHLNAYAQKGEGGAEERAHYQTFWLMLRNGGMSTYGLYAGKNLNEELLSKYKGAALRLKKATLPKAQGLIAQLELPVQTMINILTKRLQDAKSVQALKMRASLALGKLTHRIGLARDRLSVQLEESVVENYPHFTIEDDIKCPIAQEMKSAYERINILRMEERSQGVYRKGIYKQQRKELIVVANKRNEKAPALIDSIATQIKTHDSVKSGRRLRKDTSNA